MTRPVVASIDLLALRQVQIVRRAAPGSRATCGQVANAYGTAWRAYGVR